MAIPAIAWATSLNRTTVARAIAAAIATALRSVAAAIANKYVTRNIDQSNGEKAFRTSPTSFNITLMIGWFYPGRKPIMEQQYVICYSPGYRHKRTCSLCLTPKNPPFKNLPDLKHNFLGKNNISIFSQYTKVSESHAQTARVIACLEPYPFVYIISHSIIIVHSPVPVI